jgi:hypothetical protein
LAKRPLRVEEVAEVVAINVEDGGTFDEDEVLPFPDDVKSICPSLVTITVDSSRSQRVVSLAHYSVKEFLLSILETAIPAIVNYRVEPELASAFIAQCCLVYLLRFLSPGELFPPGIPWCLAEYSTQFWIQHAKDAGKQEGSIVPLASNFLSTAPAYDNWIRRRRSVYPDFLDFEPSPLYYASDAGLLTIARYLIVNGADLNANDGAALKAASSWGHGEVAKLLLEAGANVNARKDPALQGASRSGHAEVVKLLLEAGADVEAHHGRELWTASGYGNTETVKLLLESGADVHVEHGGALMQASQGGHTETVKLLLGSKPDIPIQPLSSALSKAIESENPCEEVAELLQQALEKAKTLI